MRWCLRNEVLVTGCGRGFGLGAGGSAEFSQEQEGSQGAIGGQNRVNWAPTATSVLRPVLWCHTLLRASVRTWTFCSPDEKMGP